MRAINLFCGGGGFATGAVRAGVKVVSAFDVDAVLTSAHDANFPDIELHLTDVASLSGSEATALVEGDVGLVFGGPPCQGFSNIGLRDSADPRRLLLGHFFRLVAEIRPTAFVMENVVGVTQGDARQVLEAAVDSVLPYYDVLGPVALDASNFGAATRRRRVFVIGYDPERCDPIGLEDIESFAAPAATVADAIADLEGAERCAEDSDGFDRWLLRSEDGISEYAESFRSEDCIITGQRVTAHGPEVERRFREVPQGGLDQVGRHPRLAWKGQCPTLRAGTGPDRGSFQSVRPIHPEHPRVITVREAARLQGFPDRHRFHPTIWHSFRIIGNSVSPFVAEAIFRAVLLRAEGVGDAGPVASEAAE